MFDWIKNTFLAGSKIFETVLIVKFHIGKNALIWESLRISKRGADGIYNLINYLFTVF